MKNSDNISKDPNFSLRIVSVALLLTLFCIASSVQARINVVTLPRRDSVQLTIYNSADLTLVKETRHLTFRKGMNRLEFSWANTLIDPTSLEFHGPLTVVTSPLSRPVPAE